MINILAEKMSVSVILCVFNAEKTLAATLKSIIAQTHISYELIIINDGSSDDSAAIINEYLHFFNDVSVFHQENNGIGFSRNRGVSLAKYDWLTFIDSDDLWHPQKIEKQLSVISKWPDADCVVCHNHEFEDASALVNLLASNIEAEPSSVLLNNLFTQLVSKNFNFQPATALWRKLTLLNSGGFGFERNGEDYSPFVISALHSKNFYFIEICLYYTRITKNSLSRSSTNHYTGAIARMNVIEKILSNKDTIHKFYLNKANLLILESGRQRYIQWALYGLRFAFDRYSRVTLAIPLMKKISSPTVYIIQLVKLIYLFILKK